MHKMIALIGTLTLLVVTAAAAQTPPAGAPHVTQVIVLQMPNGSSIPKLVDIAKRAQVIAMKAGSTGKARLWNLAFAGPEAGHVIIAVEFPSMAAFAESGAKLQTNPEWQKMNADAEAIGVKVVSASLAVEIPY
jgi:hypothetical protein